MFLLIPVSTSTTSTTISEDVPLTLKWFLFLQDDKGEVCFQELTDGCRVLCVYLFSQCFFNVRCADCPSSTCRLLLTWSLVGRTFVQMSLVTDHPAGRITALLCPPCFAGPPPPCTLCRAWLRRLSPYSSVCLLNAMSEGPTFDILPLENIQGSFYSKHQFGGDGGWGCLGGIASTESHKVRISSPCMLYTDCTKCT